MVGGQSCQLFPFVHPFYAFEFLLFFIHHSTLKDLSIIISFVGTHHGDLLIGFLFTFIHFCVLHCCLLGLFLCSFIFVLCIVFQTLFPHVFSLPQSITVPKPCLFPFHLIILLFSCPLWVGLLTSRHFERLMCPGFLECFQVPLVHRHVCFFISNGGLSIIFVKGIVLVAYLRSWALVAFVIASRFMLDFHLLLLESINK